MTTISWKWGLRAGLALTALAAVWLLVRYTSLGRVETWERQASPGDLSASHAFLANNCAACHTPVNGVTAEKCSSCHADAPVLRRQPTAFHATIGTCRECHTEHGGSTARLTKMDHGALAGIGLDRFVGEDASSRDRLRRLFEETGGGPHARISRREAALDCRSCHATKDRHQGLFGQDCALCHATMQWTIPEYRHPAPTSTACAECHQAPPSHYMEHFNMVSRPMAGQPHADVRQCFHCHQTTSWNDIKGLGWYKHH
jgi:hypothetical protein